MENKAELFEALKKFDTPTITNVVAVASNRPEVCLGLYHPLRENWFTDQTLKCMFPEVGRRVGYAVTVVYGLPDPNFKRYSLDDLFRAIEASPKPVALIVKQKFPEEFKNKIGLLGGNVMTAYKALGVVGVISDGPSRDLDEVRLMDIQYMLTGVTPGHGEQAIMAINVPVSVCGMDVAPGEIVHMDENGACKFPADKIEQVIALAEKIQLAEADKMAAVSKCRTAQEVIDARAGRR